MKKSKLNIRQFAYAKLVFSKGVHTIIFENENKGKSTKDQVLMTKLGSLLFVGSACPYTDNKNFETHIEVYEIVEACMDNEFIISTVPNIGYEIFNELNAPLTLRLFKKQIKEYFLQQIEQARKIKQLIKEFNLD